MSGQEPVLFQRKTILNPQCRGVSSEVTSGDPRTARVLAAGSFVLGEILHCLQIKEVAPRCWPVRLDADGGHFPWGNKPHSPVSQGQLRGGIWCLSGSQKFWYWQLWSGRSPTMVTTLGGSSTLSATVWHSCNSIGFYRFHFFCKIFLFFFLSILFH